MSGTPSRDKHDGLPTDQSAAIVSQWIDVVRQRIQRPDVELAAAFQRHYTRFGTRLPPNFCLALTPTTALAFKFDPRNGGHPRMVTPGQIKKQVGSWPRSAVRVVKVEPGRLAIGVHFEIRDERGSRVVPCRTPRLAINPAPAAMIEALGGQLPSS